ncbi:MAG: T9SS type A sorting domain-containing protein, partial [Gemmatimonadota bacterium]|nr:T9SS type A sorting domain-containing protein [Gemmatimonadota bacterium]
MMQTSVAVLVGLALSAPAVAEMSVEGRVRLASGQAAVAAQVLLFDLTDLRRGPVARATTDATGYFALASLGGPALPQGFALGQNYPNPFNPSTIIPYQLPTVAQVRLDVFNVLGQRVATLVAEEQPAGFHAAIWDATNAAGQAVAAGVYIYRLIAGGKQHTRRMVLIDGQAGVAAGVAPTATLSTASVDRTYGLAVMGAGLATYVDTDFRVGMAPVDIVVETLDRALRAKMLTGGILGDVNDDGQVDLADALAVALYIIDSSITPPNNGDISLGDVNADGQLTTADVLLIAAYSANPSDPSLPVGIGQAIGSDGNLAAGALRRLTDHSGWDGAPSWSPDGRHIAFRSHHAERDGNWDIYVMGSDGSNPTRLTDDPADDFSPSFSPDGRHIVFASERDGNWDIYVMGSDGSNPTRLTDDPAD